MGEVCMKKKSPELEKLCKFCERASSLNDPDRMLCHKKGVVSAGYSCRSFSYDPLKRDPGKRIKAEIPTFSDAEMPEV
ncbi:MAG: hypothetical protein IJ281_00580 [Clostridia bacterium]|nr:hypothetical protein [Clostridia bacterium]